MRPIIAPLRDFLHRESSSGLLILVASGLGLLVANSPISKTYFSILDWQFSLGVSNFSISFTVLKFINYVLMTLFFFVVGLEIKRELTSGHLASLKKALMPFLAALGGMAVPALIYLSIAGGTDADGWGVPVATDIALAVGLLTMVGTSAVASLRSFLLALAVIDDVNHRDCLFGWSANFLAIRWYYCNFGNLGSAENQSSINSYVYIFWNRSVVYDV
jgi:NhaA family Na+:H+ antiporter